MTEPTAPGSHPVPPVSVVIPFGSLERNLDATLAGLAAQRDAPAFEVIVVRCPAAEPGEAAIRRWSSAVDVHVARIERRGFAPASARNAGIARASGDVIVSIDDDMVVGPHFLRTHAAAHGRASAPVACIGPRRFVMPPEQPVGLDVFAQVCAHADLPQSASNRVGARSDWRLAEADDLDRHPHPYHCFLGCNASYRRADALAVGGWDEAFDGAYGYEDVAFGFRLHEAGVRLMWLADACGLHLEDVRPSAWKAMRAGNLGRVCEMVPGYADFRSAAGLAVAGSVPETLAG